jgi:hypothetical protein
MYGTLFLVFLLRIGREWRIRRMPRSFFGETIIAPPGGACGDAAGTLYRTPVLSARWARFGASLAHYSTNVLDCQIGARAMHGQVADPAASTSARNWPLSGGVVAF